MDPLPQIERNLVQHAEDFVGASAKQIQSVLTNRVAPEGWNPEAFRDVPSADNGPRHTYSATREAFAR